MHTSFNKKCRRFYGGGSHLRWFETNYGGVLRKYGGVLCKYGGVLRKYGGVLSKYSGVFLQNYGDLNE